MYLSGANSRDDYAIGSQPGLFGELGQGIWKQEKQTVRTRQTRKEDSRKDGRRQVQEALTRWMLWTHTVLAPHQRPIQVRAKDVAAGLYD